MTSPPAAARPPRVIMLKVCPMIFIAMKVTRMVTGTTSPVISAVPQVPQEQPDDHTRRGISPMMIASRTLPIDSRTMLD